GEDSVDVYVVPVSDSVAEGNETVWMYLADGDGYSVGNADEQFVTIVDESPVVSVTAATDHFSESNTETFTFTRTGSTGADLKVYYHTDGTATEGTDYASLDGYVVIAKGDSSAVVTVSASNSDSVSGEGEESVWLVTDSDENYNIDAAYKQAEAE